MKIIIFILLLIGYFLPFLWVQVMIGKIKKSWCEDEYHHEIVRQFDKMSLIPIVNILLIIGFYKGLDVFNKKKLKR